MMRQFLLFLLPFLLIGCFSSYPMGVSEDVWHNLSEKEKLDLAQKQRKLDHELALQREKNKTLEKQKALEIELEKQKQLTKLYENKTLGNIVIINFESGFLKYKDTTLHLVPQAAVVARGETKKIILQAKKKHYTKKFELYIRYDEYATQLEISFDGFGGHNEEKLVILNSGRWDRGQRYKNRVLNEGYYELENLHMLIRYHESTIDKTHLVIQR